MKVEAINGVNYRSNFTFGERIKTDNEHKNYESTSSSPLKALQKVPVIVLLAMNPATLNSAIPTQPEADNPDQIVMVEAEHSTSVKSPQVESTQKSNAPFGWEIFNSKLEDIKFSMPATGNGAPYHLVFTAPKNVNDRIDNVYLVKDGRPGSIRMGDHPAEVLEFRFHNLGSDEENFGSVITLESMLGPDRTEIGTMMREIMIEEPEGQKIVDLLMGNTKWKNETFIKFREVYDANIQEPVITISK